MTGIHMYRLAMKKNKIKSGSINMFQSIFKTFLLSLMIVSQIHFAYAQTQGSLIPNGKNIFLDNNGKPLSSGKVFFYQQNTTTPKTTYQDINQTIPNSNPVILDAGGKPSGAAGLWGIGVYRQIVQDKLGNLIWDVNTSSGIGPTGPTATGDGDAVGTIKPWPGVTAPNQYMFTYGQALNRTTYASLFQAITSQQSAICTSGSPTISGLSNTDSFWIGMSVELACVSGGTTTIISKTSFAVTLAVNANVSETITATFFMWGNGNGSTTFNLPDYRGLIPMGNNIMGGVAGTNTSDAYFGAASANSAGALGGQFGGGSATLAINNLPSHTHTSPMLTDPGHNHEYAGISVQIGNGGIIQYSGTVLVPVGAGAGAFNSTSSVTGVTLSANTGATGSATPFSVIPPSKTINFIIKVTPDTAFSGTGVTSLGGMTGDIACGTGLTCSGNIISTTSIFTIDAGGATTPISNGSNNAVLYDTGGFVNHIATANNGALITNGSGAPSIGTVPVPNGGTGGVSWTTSLPLLGNGTGQLTQGTITGNTTKFATSTGSLTLNDCVKIDTNGNLIDAGTTCGSGSNTLQNQIFATPGAVTTLTLTNAPLPTTALQLSIYFDGVFQVHSTWSLNAGTGVITFNSAIPISVQEVEALWSTPSTVAGIGSITVGASILSTAVTFISTHGISLSAMSNTLTISGPDGLFSIADYGAVSDYHESITLSTGGGASVTATGSPFTANMVGDLINITGMGVAGATYFGTIASYVNANSITVSPGTSTAQTNVYGQFCLDQTINVQITINAARSSGGGTILIPDNGTYCIQQLDFTNGSAMTLKGASTVNGSRFMPMRSTNSVMDWSGTSQVNIDGISVGQQNQLAVPSYGLVLSPSSLNPGLDFNHFNNIFWTGNYAAATLYLDRNSSSSCYKSSFLNYHQGGANTGFTGIFTHNNIFGFSSSFVTTFVGAESMSDWNFTGCEFHSIKQSGGVGDFAALYLDNTANLQFFGGNIATSHAGMITIAPGTVLNTLFQGTTFYADTGTAPVNVFTGTGNMNRTGLYFIGINYSSSAFNISGSNTSSIIAP